MFVERERRTSRARVCYARRPGLWHGLCGSLLVCATLDVKRCGYDIYIYIHIRICACICIYPSTCADLFIHTNMYIYKCKYVSLSPLSLSLPPSLSVSLPVSLSVSLSLCLGLCAPRGGDCAYLQASSRFRPASYLSHLQSSFVFLGRETRRSRTSPRRSHL